MKARISVPPDDFPADDERVVAVDCREALDVLLVGSAEDARFVSAALAPWADERAGIHVTLTAPDGIDEVDLTQYDALALVDVAIMPAGAREALAAEVKRGMGALIFAGPGISARHYSDRLLPMLGMKGVQLGEATRFPEPVGIALDERDAGPLAVFIDPAAGDVSAPRFSERRDVTVAPSASVKTWARYADGTPAVLGGALGRGRVAVLNMAPDATWSDLVRQPVFVPLLHHLIYYLAEGRRMRVMEAPVGEATVGVISGEEAEVTITGLDGTTVRAPQVENGTWRWRAGEPGVYRWHSEGESSGGFAVNLDVAESDMSRVSPALVQKLLRPARATVVPAGQAAQAAARLVSRR